jgi:hypothetical protein
MGRFEANGQMVRYINDCTSQFGVADTLMLKLPDEEDAIVVANFLNEINAKPPSYVRMH